MKRHFFFLFHLVKKEGVKLLFCKKKFGRVWFWIPNSAKNMNWDTSFTSPSLVSGQPSQPTWKGTKPMPQPQMVRPEQKKGVDTVSDSSPLGKTLLFQVVLSVVGVCIVIALTNPPFLMTRVKPPEVRCMSPLRISLLLLVVGVVTFVAARIGIKSVMQTIPSVLRNGKNSVFLT